MIRITAIAAALGLSTGCAARYHHHHYGQAHYSYAAYPTAPAQVVVSQPPPPMPLTTELRPPQPSAESSWVAGHWTYNGMWVWVDGTWISGYGGWLWTAPTIVVINGSYVLHRGYFRQRTQQPAPAYTHTHRIPISVGVQVAANGQLGARDDGTTPSDTPPDALEQPRVLSVPGATVRTPAEPTVEAVPDEVDSAPAGSDVTPPTERPVLVAPGATVVRRPVHAAAPTDAPPIAMTPDATPATPEPTPVLTNVAPVRERPQPGRGAGQVKVPGRVSTPSPVPEPAATPSMEEAVVRPTINPPVKAPAETVNTPSEPAARPTHVAPSGNASRTPTRAPNATHSLEAAVERSRSKPSNAGAAREQQARSQPESTTRSSAEAAPRRAPAAASTATSTRSKPARPTRVTPSAPATRSAERSRKDPDAAPTKKPAPTITCSLVANEAPRGGQLDVHGDGFGATPVVRIGGKVTRILRRNATDIRVQIPRDSDGGSVTVHAGGVVGECGSLTIIGTDR